MICSIFRTVVYCVGLRAAMVSWMSRTVLGPRLHKTVRISSSASVGRGGFSCLYEDFTTTLFVCQQVFEEIFAIAPALHTSTVSVTCPPDGAPFHAYVCSST